jgi:hypothetical protein
MLPVAFAAAALLGLAHPAVAYQHRYPYSNSTSHGNETRPETKVETSILTKFATKSEHAQPTATQSPTVTFINTAPSVTLSPNVHWSYDTKPVENVIPVEPKKGSELYYGVSGEQYCMILLLELR